jgi:hypothetical protein
LSICVAIDLEGVAAVDTKLSILEVRQLSICVVASFEVICKGGRFYGRTRGLEIVLRITSQEFEAIPSQLTLLMKLTKLTILRKLLTRL